MGIFLSTLVAMGTLFRELGKMFKKPEYRATFIWLLGLLLLGMVFYHTEEGWSWLDSLYFSVITLSTVGYGDLNPTTAVSKLFTIVYIFLGISIFISFASILVKERQVIRAQRIEKHQPPQDNDT